MLSNRLEALEKEFYDYKARYTPYAKRTGSVEKARYDAANEIQFRLSLLLQLRNDPNTQTNASAQVKLALLEKLNTPMGRRLADLYRDDALTTENMLQALANRLSSLMHGEEGKILNKHLHLSKEKQQTSTKNTTIMDMLISAQHWALETKQQPAFEERSDSEASLSQSTFQSMSDESVADIADDLSMTPSEAEKLLDTMEYIQLFDKHNTQLIEALQEANHEIKHRNLDQAREILSRTCENEILFKEETMIAPDKDISNSILWAHIATYHTNMGDALTLLSSLTRNDKKQASTYSLAATEYHETAHALVKNSKYIQDKSLLKKCQKYIVDSMESLEKSLARVQAALDQPSQLGMFGKTQARAHVPHEGIDHRATPRKRS